MHGIMNLAECWSITVASCYLPARLYILLRYLEAESNKLSAYILLALSIWLLLTHVIIEMNGNRIRFPVISMCYSYSYVWAMNITSRYLELLFVSLSTACGIFLSNTTWSYKPMSITYSYTDTLRGIYLPVLRNTLADTPSPPFITPCR